MDVLNSEYFTRAKLLLEKERMAKQEAAKEVHVSLIGI